MYLYSLYCHLAAGHRCCVSCVCFWRLDAFGSWPGQQRKGEVWMAVPETHFVPPVGNPSVFGRAQGDPKLLHGALRPAGGSKPLLYGR